jgi:hypothetical protein
VRAFAGILGIIVAIMLEKDENSSFVEGFSW